MGESKADQVAEREQRRAFRKLMRERYNEVLRAALAQNPNLPPELRNLRLLRPLAKAIDDWVGVATRLDIRGDEKGRAIASQVSTILHAVTDAVLRDEHAQLDAPTSWATIYLRNRHLPQPHGERSVRERAVRDAVAEHLATDGISDVTPELIARVYMAQFPEELNVYGDYLDVVAFMREKLGPAGSSRFHRMLGARSLDECAATAVALVRLMLRYSHWEANVSKNFLKADDVQAARKRKRRKLQRDAG